LSVRHVEDVTFVPYLALTGLPSEIAEEVQKRIHKAMTLSFAKLFRMDIESFTNIPHLEDAWLVCKFAEAV
jgi:hypothetical protein